MSSDKLKLIKLVCTGPLANDAQKEMWARYESGELPDYLLVAEYEQEKGARFTKGFSWDHCPKLDTKKVKA